MALSAAHGSFNTGTGAIGTTVVVSGLSFAPVVVFLWWSGTTSTTDTSGRGDMKRGFGAFTSTTSRAYTTSLAQDTPTTMVTNRMQGNAACIGVTTTADAIDGLMDVQSMDSGGFTLVVDDVFTASYRIHYLALGGTNVASATVSSFTKSDATGNQSITGVGFQPNFVLTFHDGQQSINNSVSVDSFFGLGAATASNQWAMVMGGNDAAANAQSMSYGYGAEFVAVFNSGVTAIESRATFTQFTSDGFDINWAENTAGAKIFPYVAIAFTNATDVVVGDSLTQTDTTTDITISGLSFTAAGGLIASHCAPENTADTPTDDDQWSIGGFTSTSSRGAMSATDDDAAGTAVVALGVSHDEVYQNLDAADGTVQGEMDVKTVASGSVTFIMDDADPAQNFFGYTLFGTTASNPVVSGAGEVATTTTVNGNGWAVYLKVDAAGNVATTTTVNGDGLALYPVVSGAGNVANTTTVNGDGWAVYLTVHAAGNVATTTTVNGDGSAQVQGVALGDLVDVHIHFAGQEERVVVSALSERVHTAAQEARTSVAVFEG